MTDSSIIIKEIKVSVNDIYVLKSKRTFLLVAPDRKTLDGCYKKIFGKKSHLHITWREMTEREKNKYGRK